jgi:two-component system nitrate/nitrite response regulator NarL
LTPREWKVMALAAEGLSNKEIAQRLKVATGTAKVHLNHIYRKIGVRNRTSLANLAVRYAPGSGPAGDGIAAGLGKKIHTGN